MKETKEPRSPYTYKPEPIDVKVHLPWHVYMVLWVVAVEGFSLYVWLLENPQWIN